MKIAVIDLGSNSVRMDIADIDENAAGYSFLERRRIMARLSEGMTADGNLQPEAVDRVIDALKEFKEIIDSHGVKDVIAVATAAVRGAANRAGFIRRAADETGINIRVIKGEQEAEYDFLGVISTLKIDDCVIVDTGGGSTEIILVSDREPLARTSVPVGAVNMTEQFLFRGETPEALSAMNSYISSCLDKIHWLDDAEGLPIVGMGGSIFNLAVVENGEPGVNRAALHGHEMDADAVIDTYARILDMSETERADEGIERGRTDTVPAGAAPVIELIEKLGSDRVIISSAGLKEGILAEFIEGIRTED